MRAEVSVCYRLAPNFAWTTVGPLPSGRGGFGTLYIVTGDRGEEAVAKLVPKDLGAEREGGDPAALAHLASVLTNEFALADLPLTRAEFR